jgi:hypothetical protein
MGVVSIVEVGREEIASPGIDGTTSIGVGVTSTICESEDTGDSVVGVSVAAVCGTYAGCVAMACPNDSMAEP